MSRHRTRHQKNCDRAGLIYLFVGITLLLLFSGWRFYQSRTLSFFGEKPPPIVQERKGEVPVLIKSYPLGVNIQIRESRIRDGVWQIFGDSASHLESSARIGEGGNIIIYGHNKNEILGPIRWAKPGEKIELFDEAGKNYLYQAIKIEVVDPTNLTHLLPTGGETLTVYTCTGFFDSKRLIVVAKRV
jgi:LPXTG-site transpeptidase (sortase) family protein